MILVVAASYRGFLHFCESYGLISEGRLKMALYIGDAQKLRGYENRLVLMAPGWWLGCGGSDFAKSLDRMNIDNWEVKKAFPRLKFLEVL